MVKIGEVYSGADVSYGHSVACLTLCGQADFELWPYRSRTVKLLRRYARAAVEVGRLPSLLGRDFFRARLTSYTLKNFEDIVIFVTDMEHSLDQLSDFHKTLLAMNVMEDYSLPEISRAMQVPQRTVERLVQEAIDELSRILLTNKMLEVGYVGEKFVKGEKCGNSG